MFRTVCITSGEKLRIENNWLVVETKDGDKRVPVDDLYSVVVDNPLCLLTTAAMTRLTDAGVHIVICNEKHLPASVILPQSHHYRPLNVVKKQLAMSDDFKNQLWDEVIRGKIENQAQVLRLCGGKRERVERLRQLASEVINGDEGNREGIAAKLFFRDMYGTEFVRMHDDGINAALNYGYTVVRSAFCKTLVCYGFNCVLGIHHINESNPFNLADDMMEPLRPLVDMWVDDNHEDIVDTLTAGQKNALAALTNEIVLCDGKKMALRNAIDTYICSLTSAIEHHDAEKLKIPTVIRTDIYRDEDDGDD